MLDLLFPKRCLGCRLKGCYFCHQCCLGISFLPFLKFPVISFFPYQGVIKKAILKLKYRFITDLANELVDLVLKIVNEQKDFSLLKTIGRKRKVVLVPLPLYPRRENWRGFNQSELLGRKLAKALGWQIETNLLFRIKNTLPQANLKAKERRENIKDSFRVSPKMASFLKNNLIILFDDVWTTGYTMKEASRVLQKSGFKKIYRLTICR